MGFHAPCVVHHSIPHTDGRSRVSVNDRISVQTRRKLLEMEEMLETRSIFDPEV